MRIRRVKNSSLHGFSYYSISITENASDAFRRMPGVREAGPDVDPIDRSEVTTMRRVLLYILPVIVFCQMVWAAPKESPGPIMIQVDVREAARKIFHAKLLIPVKPGPLTLLYPKYIPGEHGPTGPITDLVGLKFSAAGKQIPWQRDLVDMYTFHCEIPPSASSLEVSLDFVSAIATDGFSSGASASDQLAVISWNQLLLYPQGVKSDDLTYTASLQLPQGWKYGTALSVAKETGNAVEFKPVSLTTLVDSPVNTGAHFKVIDLSPDASPAHVIDLVGDSEEAINMSPETIASYRKLIPETGALFGARHYREYHFLYTLSDHVSSFGLEHHESSDDRLGERTLLTPALQKESADLLTHEMVHSWNGKYRRPFDLATPEFQQPMKTDLLWVYEGLTQYLGNLLAARIGLMTPEEYRERVAWTAAYLDNRPGRTWRSLSDTAVAAQLLYDARREWDSWRRDVDFYDESLLIWLEADTIIRKQTAGARSLDDFCRLFYGGQSGKPELKTYTFEDVTAAMNQIAPYDWKSFFQQRLNSLDPHSPQGGIEAGGWRLILNETPNTDISNYETERKNIDMSFSIGLSLSEAGAVRDIIPGMPAAKAGIAPGMKLIAVNGRIWSKELLHAALKETKNSSQPLELLLENDEFIRTYRLDYHGGEQYPHLERIPDTPDLLEQTIKPLT